MSLIELVGWAAALVGTVLGLPQVVRLVRTRSVDGMSLPAWQAILCLNVGWAIHGVLIGQLNMILPNVLGLVSTLPILVLMARELHRPLFGVLLPGIAGAAAMITVDLVLGTAAYGLVALIPALLANIGQSIELVRAPLVDGVSPVFLAGGVLNQLLWLSWGLLVNDAGTFITASVTLGLTGFNLAWWTLRRFGLRPFFVVLAVPEPETSKVGS